MSDLTIRTDARSFAVTGLAAGGNRTFETAGDALAAAFAALPETGGHIRLASGDYPIDRSVRVPSRAWIQGSGRGTRLLVTSAAGGLVLERVDGAVVSDLSLHARSPDAEAGVILHEAGDCRVSDVFAEGFATAGVWLRNSSFLCELRGVRAAGNRRANILLDDLFQGRGGDWVPCLVTNCMTYGGGHGVELRRAIVVNLVACAVHQPGGHAYYIHESSNSILLSGCRSYQVERDAVHVHDSHEFNATGNIFCWHRGHGVVLRDVAWATVSGNNIIDSGVRAREGGLTHGVLLAGETRGVQVSGNALFNWGDQCPMDSGIREEPTAHHNSIVGNNINYCRSQAVEALGTAGHRDGNLAATDAAFVSMGKPPYPDFTREKIDRFITSQARP